MSNGKPPKKRDPLLDAADALESGHLTHQALVAMNTPERVAEGYRQDTDLGTVAAAGLGAARGASFGLGDLAQRLLLNAREKQAVGATASEHPYATTAGTIAGAAIPFLLTGGESGAALPGLGVRGTQVALGAAQGAGLTPGGVTNRAIGAGLGGATALAAPALASGASAIARRVPILGPMLRQAAGIQPGFPRALAAAPEATLPGGMTEAAARASLGKQGFSPEMIEKAMQAAKGAPAMSQDPLLPALRAVADPRETIPAYIRNAQTPVPLAAPDALLNPVPTVVSPQSQQAAARSAYHLADAAGVDPLDASRRAAGTYSGWDPRQALVLSLLLGSQRQRLIGP